MTYRIVVEPEVLQDMQNIYTYIFEHDTLKKAGTFINELKSCMESLDSMPMRCRRSLYADDETIRDLIYKGYTIVFQIKETTVHVLTLFRQREY